MDSASGSASPFLTTAQAAAVLRMEPSTLDHWRSEGAGPVFYKIGRRIYYKRADLDAWIESRKRRSTAEHKAGRQGGASPTRDASDYGGPPSAQPGGRSIGPGSLAGPGPRPLRK